MIILGIETSCDDTGIAIIEAAPQKGGVKFNILANIVSSQIKTHAPFGGVVPNLAAREHLKNIEPCLKNALKEANKTMEEIDLIAVTVGPGLIPSLLIGVNFAKALAYKYNIPIVPINHLEGHITAAINDNFSRVAGSRFARPAIALLVSGGHTQLILMKKSGSYKIIGETRDDAAGECFDKVAKLLGLEYPGGPLISKEAAKFNGKTSISLPRPMIHHKNFDFSFSGLKTAVLYLTQDNKDKMRVPEFVQEICHETQQAIIDVLIDKTFKAVEKYKAKTIILSGGVAANTELRKQFILKIENWDLGINFLVPPKNLCMDNGAMIAMAGYFVVRRDPDHGRGDSLNRIIANANLRIK
jgi:N6-L-threonylcarbamoyladenine synthase